MSFMETKRKVILVLPLALILFVSGCSFLPNGDGGNGNNGQDLTKAIEINNFLLEPSVIYSQGTGNLKLDLTNVGPVNANLDIGDQGNQILVNSCPSLLQIKSFDAIKNGYESVNYGSLELAPGDSVSFKWNLEAKKVAQTTQCDLETMLNFDYDLSAYKWVQIRENDMVEPTSRPGEGTKGPLNVKISFPSGSQHKVGEQFTVLLYLKNKGEGEAVIDSNNINVETDLTGSCNMPQRKIELDSGESIRFSCDFRKSSLGGAPSQVYRIDLTADYNYLKSNKKTATVSTR